jgi:peptidoglycan/LPS O-acetylase OafA/YrhL
LANLIYYHPGGSHFSKEGLSWFLGFLGSGTTSILWGSLTAILLFKGLIPLDRLKKFGWLSLPLLALILLLQSKTLFNYPGKQMANLYLAGPMISLVLLLAIQETPSISFRALNNAPIKQIGVLSYSLYIWQQLFTHDQPWRHLFPYADSVWVNLPALILVASLSFYCFERPFLNLRKKFRSEPLRKERPAPTQSMYESPKLLVNPGINE